MIRRSVMWTVLGATTVAVLLAVGFLVPNHGIFALAAAILILVLGLTAYQPAAVPILAMPALVVVERVGGGGVDLSLSDFALFGAFWFALVFAPRPFTPPMRALLWLAFTYQVATLFTVVANPFRANTVEWFHAWLSVAGALVVGWAVGRLGQARLGLALLMVPCVGIAVLTILTAAQQLAAGNTGAVYLEFPYPMHKNLIGIVLSFAALIAYTRPTWLGWPKKVTLPLFWLLSLAVLASQARQALVGLAVVILVVALRSDPDRKRSKVIFLAVIPALYFAWLAVQEQLAEDNEHNSAQQRLSWYEDSIDVWLRQPWVGMGLRWWTAGRTEFVFQPPNAELEMLTAGGLIGLAGFLVLFVGALIVLFRVDPRYGTLAFCAVLMRFIQGQFDLFWASVVVTIPFVIAGVCLGAQAYAQASSRDGGHPQQKDAHARSGDPIPARDKKRDVEDLVDV